MTQYFMSTWKGYSAFSTTEPRWISLHFNKLKSIKKTLLLAVLANVCDMKVPYGKYVSLGANFTTSGAYRNVLIGVLNIVC